MDQISSDRFKTAILLLAVAGLLSGLACYSAGKGDIANLVWSAAVIPALAALVVEIVRSRPVPNSRATSRHFAQARAAMRVRISSSWRP